MLPALEKANALADRLIQDRAARIQAAKDTIEDAKVIGEAAAAEMADAVEKGDEAAFVIAKRKADDAAARAEFAKRSLDNFAHQAMVGDETDHARLLRDEYAETMEAYQKQSVEVIKAYRALIAAEEQAAQIANAHNAFVIKWHEIVRGNDAGLAINFPYNHAHFHMTKHKNDLTTMEKAEYLKNYLR